MKWSDRFLDYLHLLLITKVLDSVLKLKMIKYAIGNEIVNRKKYK